MALALAGPSQFIGSAQPFLQNLTSLIHSIPRPTAVTSTAPKQSQLSIAAPFQHFVPAVAEVLCTLPAAIPRPTHLQHIGSANLHSFRAPTATSVLLAAPLRLSRTVPQRRAYSTRSSFSPLLHVIKPAPSGPGAVRRQIQQVRPITWFPKAKPTLEPLVVARIGRAEADANANPDDVNKQVALFRELVAHGGKDGCERVIARWERTCQFSPQSPLIKSDAAFSVYCSALTNSGAAASVMPAAVRREQLLKTPVPVEAEVVPSTPESSSEVIAKNILATPKNAQPTMWGTTPIEATPAAATAPQPAVVSTVGNSTAEQMAAAVGSGAGIKGNPIHVVMEEPRGAMFWKFMRFVGITVLYGFILLTVLGLVLENSGLMKAGPRQTEFEPTPGKTVTFGDVHGVDEAKDELQEIVEFLKDPGKFSTLGGRLPKGVLLTGPPGTGKTLLARAVAGEAGVPFFFASGAEFDEMFVGVGAKRIRDLFAAARKKQPAIIFIDELDAIGGKRSPRDQHYMKQTLNQLLVELDGFSQTEGVIVIAATNFPETLDHALVRPGRFDRHVAVPLPDIKGRVQILKHHMREVTADIDVDAAIIARGTPGFSGADLQNMVNQAAIQASREGAKSVTLKHFEWAKDKILMGSERKSAYMPEDVKKLTAYHEGGHALVALYTQGAMPLHKVTCVPRGHALGLTLQLPDNDRQSVSFKEFLAEIDVCMGGRVAEELIFGKENVTSGARSDLQHASRTASNMVKHYGYSDKVGLVYHSDNDSYASPEKKNLIEMEVQRFLDEGHKRAKELLKLHEVELHRLAEALVKYETLDLEEVKKVIKGEDIRIGENLATL
ncbi:ATP-dependent metallopeptidase Hfl [Dacryopinax primogenitus]|uniref:ATP-dependent metallopeptidase Hfl n=1 Tax=Dacryopinax primogenitus (strain DJM 731) TaxID=1858805 RepID=M5GAA4_DACPD|nr:ATP-dependent metallopeptidase Hfl [Dacryopinax primogenitus]EJU00823.1 ATP-dependent metallopeptidase Hfl [Dacryopinax primogenitus]